MDDWQNWTVFLAAAVALNVSPGPDTMFVLGQSVAHGRRVGVAATFGTCSGAALHVVAAALGLSAILAASPTAFWLVKAAGAVYLGWLGIRMIWNATEMAAPETRSRTVTPGAAYRQGLLIDILNPKVALFFMAFLPQFADPARGNVAAQLLTLGAIVVLIAMAWELLLVFGAAAMSGFIRRNAALGRWTSRVFGLVLIGLGLRLALAEA